MYVYIYLYIWGRRVGNDTPVATAADRVRFGFHFDIACSPSTYLPGCQPLVIDIVDTGRHLICMRFRATVSSLDIHAHARAFVCASSYI